MRYTRSNPERRGVTLVELLVVISIMLLLAAVAVPAMRPMMEGRRIREAARAINVYLSSARSEAMRTGQPVGVMLRRLDGQPECSTVLEQAEFPPTYAGDSTDATVRVQTINRTTGQVQIFVQLSSPLASGLIHSSDRIQFNHQGPWYWFDGGPDSNTDGLFDFSGGTDSNSDGYIDSYTSPLLVLTAHLDSPQSSIMPWPDTPAMSEPMPFEIIRQPMKSTAKPLQLPSGAVVDLIASGTDNMGIHSFRPYDQDGDATNGIQDQRPVYLMFSPNGSIYAYYHSDSNPLNPTRIGGFFASDPIFLLVGRRERVTGQTLPTTPTADEKPNWADMGNLWVTLNPQTGLVSVAENSQVNATENPVGDVNCDPNNDLGTAPAFSWSDPTTWNAAIGRTRQYARQAQSVGGR